MPGYLVIGGDVLEMSKGKEVKSGTQSQNGVKNMT